MGLAASQSRFLAITARKMNCEFQSMQIAQQKLSVTRDQQRASQAYQNALDATRLVWEADDSTVYDLSYDLMMKPSEINGYNPYLLTDTQGKVVLTEAMFKAAQKAGIIDDQGNPQTKPKMGESDSSDGSRNAFLYQLKAINQIDGAVADNIIQKQADGYSAAGIGGDIMVKNGADAMTSNVFMRYLQEATYADSSEVPPTGKSIKDKLYSINLVEVLNVNENYIAESSGDLKDSTKKFYVSNNGQSLSTAQIKNLTIGDIILGNYQISFRTSKTDDAERKADYKDQFTTILKAIAEKLGYNRAINGESTKGLYIDTQTDLALNQAMEFTKALFNSTTEGGTNDASSLNKKAQEQNNVIVSNDETKYAVSLTNMVKSFLTNFAIALDGFDCGFNIAKESVKDSNYVTNDYGYYFVMSNDAAITDTTLLNADFYNMLYNQIAMNGACTDKQKQEQVTDNNYIAHALKNGQMFISSLNTDGYFYQGAYTLNGHVAEVKDEDAIARAELDYNVTKSKLNYKEETLELKMKNLDMEIAALTTEFDTVKNMISKNVEKVFTMFSN